MQTTFPNRPSFCASGAPTKPPYLDDALTYGVLIVHEDDGPRVRQRRSVWDWTSLFSGSPMGDLSRYHLDTGRRIEYRVGKLGQERLRYFAEGGRLYAIDGSGVPADRGAA